ncbi:phage baseplate assembly protein V [Vibrio sp. AND4]|uniref:CIS tube protein n=1 Tax=Vibrio sp. AND4 TaxID=314289 RepID=UPI0005C5490B|nr:phage baseplate assembly protein V [Vibrio sp. AND4]
MAPKQEVKCMLSKSKKLAKLKIVAYRERERAQGQRVGDLDVLYNPDTLTLSYHNEYRVDDYCSEIKSNTFCQSHAGTLSLALVMDAKMSGNKNGIAEQIKQLKALCYQLDKTTLSPRFLAVSWGQLSIGNGQLFSGRVQDFAIDYTSFARDGTPLRAEVQLTLIEDPKLPRKEENQDETDEDGLFNIVVKGKPLKQLSLAGISSTQQINGIPKAKLQLCRPGIGRESLKNISEVADCQIGEEVKVYSGKRNPELIFKGIITAYGLEVAKGDEVLNLELQHPLCRLDNTNHSQVFLDQNDSQIISKLCHNFNVGTIRYLGDAKKKTQQVRHEQKVQFRCSDWHFIRSCLDANGVWMIANPDNIEVITPQLKTQTPDHQLSADSGDKIYSASWAFTSMDQPDALEMSSWDIKKQKLQTQKASVPLLGDKALKVSAQRVLDPTNWSTHYSVPKDKREIKAWADSVMAHLSLSQVQGSVEIQGTTKYKLGDTVKFSEFGTSIDGSAIVTSVSHTITSAEWTTRITFGSEGLSNTLSPLPSINGIHLATVAKYESDSKSFDRIGVHIPALNADKQKNKLWARFSMPYASKGSGMYCYPEQGDEVILGFIEDNPCYPVILGSLHNPINTSALKPGDAHKGWKLTQAGAELEMLLNTNDKNLLLKSGEQRLEVSDTEILIDSPQEVNIYGTEIDIASPREINITGEDSVEITGTEINMKKPS